MRKFSTQTVTRTSGALTGIGFVAFPAIVFIQSAYADEISDAVNGLVAENVYVSSDDVSANEANSLIGKYDNSSVGIVMVPSGNNASEMADGILHKTGSQYKTIIVISADDSTNMVLSDKSKKNISNDNYSLSGDENLAVASIGDASKIYNTITNDESSNLSYSDLISSLDSNSSEVISLTGKANFSTTATVDSVQSDPLTNVAAVTGGFLSSLLGIAVVSTAIIQIMKRRKKKIGKVIYKDLKSYPDELANSIDKLQKLVVVHKENNLAKTSAKIQQILQYSQELFHRLKKKGTNDQLTLAYVKYTDIFNKLAFAMDEDHYIDIIKNGDFWDDPKKRIDDTEKVLTYVENELMNNIKKVNSSKDLDFEVALGALMNLVNNDMTVEEVYKKENVIKENVK